MSGGICPCDGSGSRRLVNPPGLTAVAYRAADFGSVRHALLQPLAGEQALNFWRPMPHGDLLLQILEWWAYIADVLCFYNERSLNANLLGTATLDADVRGLIRILGYRPRPGLGGSAVVAALLGSKRPVTLPAGFAIQSKPAPGKLPQIFETAAPTALSLPDAVPARKTGRLAGGSAELYLDGIVKTIQPADRLLLAPKSGFSGAVLVEVQSIRHARDSSGVAYTEIVPAGAPALPAADAAGYRLLSSGRRQGLWKFNTKASVVAPSLISLEGLDRTIAAGQVIVMIAPNAGVARLTVQSTQEEIWYANGDASTPPGGTTPAIGLPITRVEYATKLDSAEWNKEARAIVVLSDWRPAGVLRNLPVDRVAAGAMTLVADPGHSFPVSSQMRVILEDAVGNGGVAVASVDAATPTIMSVASVTGAPASLLTPVRVLPNVIDLTRGRTIDREAVGAGDASVPNQEFVLQKSPLTYYPAGDSYRSSLALFVDGLQWTEVASFYAQPPDARVFTTFEDDAQKTHVRGGDGINGALFPTGAAIVARYRVESGLEAPEPGALTTILKPFLGVRAVRYPVRGGGGADPDPPALIRRYAPRSVLTFGRAIAAGDYEAIAGGAPSVTRVRAYYEWNAAEQRATVVLYVGDTAAAVTSARNALSMAADPNRTVDIQQAASVPIALDVSILIQPGRIEDDVRTAVRAALSDPDRGLLGERRTGIGETIYFSQIADACIAVEGVQAVAALTITLPRPDPQTGLSTGTLPRLNTAPGEFLALAPGALQLASQVLPRA